MSNSKFSDNAIARIAASFASRTDTTSDDILALVAKLRQEFGAQDTTDSLHRKLDADKLKPVLPLNKAVTQDQVFCLCCGKGFKMLKRHLGVEHGLNEREYREVFNLPDSMPLVAPSYSDKKAAHAKKLGLGKYHRDASKRDEAYSE